MSENADDSTTPTDGQMGVLEVVPRFLLQLAKEIFQVAEWGLVLVAVKFAHHVLGTEILDVAYKVLYVLLWCYLAARAMLLIIDAKKINWQAVPTMAALCLGLCIGVACAGVALAVGKVSSQLTESQIATGLKGEEGPSG